jgi:NADP-dependent 3-hydroxy acid dehydrogenase YdfG
LKVLLAKNAKVYMAGRSSAKLAQSIKQIKAATGKEGIPLLIDLADLPSIKRGVEEFLRFVLPETSNLQTRANVEFQQRKPTPYSL